MTAAFLDVPYLPSSTPFQRLDLHLPADASILTRDTPLLLHIHGGAWRASSRDKFSNLAIQFAGPQNPAGSQAGIIPTPTALLGYRLSKAGGDVVHPMHTEDCAAGVALMCALAGGVTVPQEWVGGSLAGLFAWWRPRRIFISGHSAGGTMACLMSLRPSLIDKAMERLMKQDGVSGGHVDWRGMVKGFISVEGITDLRVMCEDFPTYEEWFVAQAFGKDKKIWDEASPARIGFEGGEAKRWPYLVLHSKQDTLVNTRQANVLVENLRRLGDGVEVTVDVSSLKADHDDTLNEPAFFTAVRDFVSKH
ncbi:Kynurenine formamidase [Irineochytrium annulatum]|nr:Kynurenine formamidase [Irineochytrium annulatum]